MNFGQELQDFIAGFDAGWGMANKREEREWEREKRQMAREDHTYRRERDAIGDDQWERNFSYRQGRDAIGDRQWQDQFNANEHQRGITNTHNEIRLQNERDRLDQGIIDEYTGDGLSPEDQNAVDGFDTWYEGSTDGDVESRHASLISNESGGNWRAQNDAEGHGGLTGHFGRLQFGQARLQDAKNAGVIPAGMTPQQFMNSPDAQRAVENWHFADIDRQAERLGLNRYLGQNVGGVQISPDAIRAMAHLGGIGGAQRFLETGGQYNPSDRNGTTLLDYARRHGGQSVAHMARGGVVPTLDEDEDEIVTAQPNIAPAQPVIPDDESMPAPRYAQADTGQSTSGQTEHIVDPYERGVQAALDGLRRAQELSNIHTQEVLDSPEVQQAREAYLRGYGAAPQQIIRQAQDRIDPDRTMPASERNIRAIGAAWQYFMDQGEYENAQTVAASMVQAMRQEEQKFAAIAASAAEEGDIDTAVRAAVTAYANVPNGMDLDITPNEDGTYSVAIVEQRSGEAVSEQTMSPREIAAMAMGADIGNFDEWILNAAGLAGPRFEAPSLSDSRAGEAGASEATEIQLAEAGLSPTEMGAIRDVASGIANIAENRMGPEAAVSFVSNLFAFDANDPSNQEPNFEIHDVPGDPSSKLIVSNGMQVYVPANQAAVLQQARGAMAEARQAQYEADREGEAWRQGVVDRGVQAAQDFGAALWNNTVPGMVMNNTDVSNAPVIPEEDQPAANPYGATPLPNEDTDSQIQRYLDVRNQLLAKPELREANPEQYDRMLQHAEEQLRALGYDLDQEANPPR